MDREPGSNRNHPPAVPALCCQPPQSQRTRKSKHIEPGGAVSRRDFVPPQPATTAVEKGALAPVSKPPQPGSRRLARRRFSATGIVWSPDGVIVTAHHVVEQDNPIHIGLADGQTVSATVVGRDPTTDLAVLRAQVTSLRALAWIEPDMQSLRVGHLVLALGRPRQTVQATLGIVSALGAGWRTPAGGQIDR